MSREEFERALHGAPTLVKGRGMNEQIEVLWNALDAYINAQDKAGVSKVIPAWLREWRQHNALPHTSYYHLNQLNDYINVISSERAQLTQCSFFSSNIKDIKYQLADNLMDQLQNHFKIIYAPKAYLQNEPCLIECENDKWRALHNGRLGSVIAALEKDGIIKVKQHEPAKTMRYQSV